MDNFNSFVPAALLERIKYGKGDTPVGALFPGAALFADITDYTVLAEQLCEQGTDGAERLAALLDQAFRRYVGCVHATGGEVACFAGDALLAYWPAEDGDLARALALAEECAQQLHSVSRAETTPLEQHPMLHVGLGAGPLWIARLGGIDGLWHLVVAGSAVRDAEAAAARAGTGETSVAPTADASGGAEYVIGPRAPLVNVGGEVETAAEVSEPTVTSFVPRVVQEWVAEGYAAWLPQLRSITALFVRIEGLDETAPDALERHQSAVAAMLTVLQPYSGSSGTLVFDDKGLVFKLCFGMPHDSHADDASRAVRTALAIEAELKRQGLNCSAGIASGRGVCTSLGGPERQHYVAVGRFMHVAARLMQEAAHGVLCTADIADHAPGGVQLNMQEPVALKGIREPVRSFRVIDAPRRYDVEERLFGREFEKKQIEGYLDALQEAQGRMLWVVGDAGVGKTALMRYLARAASLRGVTCLLGGAGSFEISVPYLAWRPVFAQLLESATAEGAQAKSSGKHRGDLLRGLPHPDLAPLVNAVLPGYLEETAFVSGLSGDARANATLTVLSEVIGYCAPSRLVLVVEDCHWMDSASWRLVLRIAQDHPSILLVLTSRPAKEGTELDALRRLDRFVEVALAPLRSDSVRLLVDSLLEHGDATSELVEEIAGRSAGNPLFVREYTLLLVSKKRLVHEEMGWGLVSSPQQETTEPLPATVLGLITSRLDTLSPEEELAVKTASVLGDRFDEQLLSQTYPAKQTRYELRDVLTTLVQNQLLIQAGNGERGYLFRHALIREATYAQLTLAQRQKLHRSAAEALESRHAEDLAPHFAVLAHHWSKAEESTKTVRYADPAASQALASGAYLEAERLLQTCIEIAEDSGATQRQDGVRWFRQLADARRGLGQLETRANAARQALSLAGQARPRTYAGLLLRAAFRGMRVYLRRVFAPNSHRGDSSLTLELARAYRHSAEVCYFNNDTLGMICDSVSAVERAEAAEPSAVLAGAATELGGILTVAGLRRIGEKTLQRAIDVAETTDNSAALAYAHMISGLYAVGVGDWLAAERSATICQDLCEPANDRVNWTNAQAVRFWLNHYQGREDAAHETARQLQGRASETGNRQHQAWALRYLALCELRQERPAQAADRLERALDCLGETAALNELIPPLGLLALAKLRTGEVWAARPKAKDGFEKLSKIKRPIGHHALESYAALTEVALDAWREVPEDWHREVQCGLRALRRYKKAFPVGEPRYWLRQGDYHRLSGKQAAAQQAYRHGVAAAARLGMAWDEARCAEALERS